MKSPKWNTLAFFLFMVAAPVRGRALVQTLTPLEDMSSVVSLNHVLDATLLDPFLHFKHGIDATLLDLLLHLKHGFDAMLLDLIMSLATLLDLILPLMLRSVDLILPLLLRYLDLILPLMLRYLILPCFFWVGWGWVGWGGGDTTHVSGYAT